MCIRDRPVAADIRHRIRSHAYRAVPPPQEAGGGICFNSCHVRLPRIYDFLCNGNRQRRSQVVGLQWLLDVYKRQLKESVADAEGFIRAERFSSLATEGKLLSMSVWENEDCVSKWRNFAAHRMAQKHGRMNDFADYKITVVTPVRSYTMNDRAAAPAYSNAFLEV